MKTSNIFEHIPKDLQEEIFEDIVKTDKLQIQRIISKGDSTLDSKWYNQTDNEWVIILQGEAILSFKESKDIKLKTGDYINIQAHIVHKVLWTTPDTETIWLAIHY